MAEETEEYAIYLGGEQKQQEEAAPASDAQLQEKLNAQASSDLDEAEQEEEIDNDLEERYLVFRLGEHDYATALLSTREVIEPLEFREVPNTTDYFLGIANLRGEVVGLVDMGKMLGIQRNESDRNVIIVYESDSGPLGAVIDSIKGVFNISEDMIEKEANIKTKVPMEYFVGVARLEDQLIPVIELKKLLGENDMVTIRKSLVA